ncbi:glycosyltransferase [bacterium]|nr:glycosyltransferase [bacterium]
MKIFYSVEAYFPHISGVTIVTDRLATHFGRKKEDQVWVVTASASGDFKVEQTHKGYTILRIKSFPNPIRRKIRVSYLAKLEISRVLDKYHPDLIHLQDPLFISQALATEAKERNIPVIATQHSSLAFPLAYLGLPKLLQRFAGQIMAKILANFYNNYLNLMIVPSRYIKSEVQKWGVTIPVQVISNGIDLNFFKTGRVSEEFLQEYKIADLVNEPLVLYTGRIDKDKNLEVLLEAIPLVLQRVNARFLLVGSGDLKEKLITKVQESSFKNRVTFIGPLKPGDEDLPEFYQLADLFVMPSYIEAQSLVTMEAMASGLPIVAANGGALPELVRDGENGFLVDPHNPQSFAEAIIKILTNPELAKRFSLKSKEFIKPHDRRLVFQKIEEIYQELVNKKK